MSKVDFSNRVFAFVSGDAQASKIVHFADVLSAINACLRGTTNEYKAAITMIASLRTARAKASRAGFIALGDITRFPYKGKLTEETKIQIAAKAEELLENYKAAFDAAMNPVLSESEKNAKEVAKAAQKQKQLDKKNEERHEWAIKNGYIPKGETEIEVERVVVPVHPDDIPSLLEGMIEDITPAAWAAIAKILPPDVLAGAAKPLIDTALVAVKTKNAGLVKANSTLKKELGLKTKHVDSLLEEVNILKQKEGKIEA